VIYSIPGLPLLFD